MSVKFQITTQAEINAGSEEWLAPAQDPNSQYFSLTVQRPLAVARY